MSGPPGPVDSRLMKAPTPLACLHQQCPVTPATERAKALNLSGMLQRNAYSKPCLPVLAVPILRSRIELGVCTTLAAYYTLTYAPASCMAKAPHVACMKHQLASES